MQSSVLGQWTKGEEGATAVEFSLVAIPFILMIIGLVEMALMFSAASLLEGATGTAARLIRTGQAQAEGEDAEQVFRDALCDFSEVFIPCERIEYEVVEIEDGTFGSADSVPPPSFDEDGDLASLGFNPGGSSSVVMVRVFYRYPIVTPLMQTILTNAAGNTRLLMSTTVFESEPYNFSEEIDG